MKVQNPSVGGCKTPEELSEAIKYHLEQGGMRLCIINETKGIRETVYDDAETRGLYGNALNNYLEIRKSYPNLPLIQISTSDPLSGLAQIRQLCDESIGTARGRKGGWIGNFFWKLYEMTLKIIVDAVLERWWPK
jgi:hypothetical protein